MLQKDVLFLLPPGFEDNGRREYCPECAEIWGALHYFPLILVTTEIRYQPTGKPRAEMVGLLGEENQNCPTLVLADLSDPGKLAEAKRHEGYKFFDNARDIGKYFSSRYGTAFPRGE